MASLEKLVRDALLVCTRLDSAQEGFTAALQVSFTCCSKDKELAITSFPFI